MYHFVESFLCYFFNLFVFFFFSFSLLCFVDLTVILLLLYHRLVQVFFLFSHTQNKSYSNICTETKNTDNRAPLSKLDSQSSLIHDTVSYTPLFFLFILFILPLFLFRHISIVCFQPYKRVIINRCKKPKPTGDYVVDTVANFSRLRQSLEQVAALKSEKEGFLKENQRLNDQVKLLVDQLQRAKDEVHYYY